MGRIEIVAIGLLILVFPKRCDDASAVAGPADSAMYLAGCGAVNAIHSSDGWQEFPSTG